MSPSIKRRPPAFAIAISTLCIKTVSAAALATSPLCSKSELSQTYTVSASNILKIQFTDESGAFFDTENLDELTATTRLATDKSLRKCRLKKELIQEFKKLVDGTQLLSANSGSTKAPWLGIVLREEPFPHKYITISNDKNRNPPYFCKNQNEIFAALKRLFKKTKEHAEKCEVVSEPSVLDRAV